jgi:glycosyltransferase involved in cell wall biosynthesis
MSKVYFVGNSYFGCYYVRCFLPFEFNGWSGTHYGLTKKTMKPEKIIMQEMLNADVIVFHRPNTNWHHRIGMLLRERGKKIVFDNDDTYLLDRSHAFYAVDERGFEQNKYRLNNVVNNFALNADLITCSTEFLKREYLKLNKNVVVLPNCVNPDDWPKPLRNEGDKIRVGLVGSVAYHSDFNRIRDVIKRLDDDGRFQLVLFGLWGADKKKKNPLVTKIHKKEYEFWESLKNIEHVPWCDMAYYFDTLNQLRLDFMLIPREDNYFNRCKSNIKFLEASMLEIPVMAQGMKDGPYQELDGEIGVRIDDDKNWWAEIEAMTNKGKRLMMGVKAKDYVIKNYNIKDHAHLWADTYNKII